MNVIIQQLSRGSRMCSTDIMIRGAKNECWNHRWEKKNFTLITSYNFCIRPQLKATPLFSSKLMVPVGSHSDGSWFLLSYSCLVIFSMSPKRSIMLLYYIRSKQQQRMCLIQIFIIAAVSFKEQNMIYESKIRRNISGSFEGWWKKKLQSRIG